VKEMQLRILRSAARYLFVLCLPILLIAGTVRLAVNEVRLYEYGFDKYDVSQETGLDDDELRGVAKELIDYFNSGDEEFEFFTDREVAHLKDVRGLIQLDYRFHEATLAYILGFAVVGLLWSRGRSWKGLARLVVWGSVLTIALMIVLGLGAVIGFGQLFHDFHVLSFSNDLWKLSSGDYLLMMFPESFFRDATLFIAGAIVGEALLLGGIARGLLAVTRKRARMRVRPGGGAGEETVSRDS
jgi:integral membrane protein (TIGR01906 family)